MNKARSLFVAVAILLAAPALAWDEDGHVIVTRCAHTALPKEMPDWVRSPEVRARLEYLCAEPDRWRGQHNLALDHMNEPNHYFDLEGLAPYGLTLRALPPLRREFLDLLATQRALHPDRFPKYDRERDQKYTRLIPGLLPYEIVELQWKLAASWTTLKTYEKHRDRVTDEMIKNARENVIYDMGILSHYIGDGSQPLHVTHHHNGWQGDNPKDYTRDSHFHSKIDGGVIAYHHLAPSDVAARARPPRKVSTTDYWKDIAAYLQESADKVEPLYELEKKGALEQTEGRKFIEDRLLEGGAMLSGVWLASYEASHIDEFREKRLLKK